MIEVNAFYRKNIRPFAKGVIVDYLDREFTDLAPDSDDLSFAEAQDFLGLLWEYDDRNVDPFEDEALQATILDLLKSSKPKQRIDVSMAIQEALFSYYKEMITDILSFEFVEVYSDFRESQEDLYTFDPEC